MIFQGTDEVRAEDTEVLELRCKLNALWFFGNSTKSWKLPLFFWKLFLQFSFVGYVGALCCARLCGQAAVAVKAMGTEGESEARAEEIEIATARLRSDRSD